MAINGTAWLTNPDSNNVIGFALPCDATSPAPTVAAVLPIKLAAVSPTVGTRVLATLLEI